MKPLKILLAGASGVVGRRLAPMLVDAGHAVYGITRSIETAQRLEQSGVVPLVADVFDKAKLHDVASSVRPDIVVHQLTDLPPGLVSDRMEEFIRRNARIRKEGTANLIAASAAAGARRIIAQSIAWAYRAGTIPHVESDPLDTAADGLRGITVSGVASLEHLVLQTTGMEGVVLRYGYLYGPGTGFNAPAKSIPLHVDAAAHAARLAIDRECSGVFNIAEDDPALSTARAKRELGWDAHCRLG